MVRYGATHRKESVHVGTLFLCVIGSFNVG
jgi:hypothetical protein